MGGTPSVAMYSWTLIAVTCEQDNRVKLFFNGEMASIHRSALVLKDTTDRPPEETFRIDHFLTSLPLSRLLIMDLHILGFASPPDEIFDLYRGQ